VNDDDRRGKCKYWVKPTIYNCRLIYIYYSPREQICYCEKRQGVGNCRICKEYEEGDQDS